MMVVVPAPDGVKVTEQLPLASEQEGTLKVPAEPLAANDTVPPGVDGLPEAVSATVAVHVDALPTTTLDGAHARVVLLDRRVAVTGALPELVA